MRKIQLWAAVTLVATFCAAPYTTAEATAKTPALFSQGRNNTAQRIIDELNLVRSNPAAYADSIEKNRDSIPAYKEGPKVIDETIQVLRSTPTLPPLTLSSGMSLAARDHVQDTGPKGTVGHDGSDGSQPWDRIARYGSASGEQAENVSYGANSAREVVVQLLVDDGVPSRGHRESILSPKYRVAGVACGSHAQYRIMCVIDYAQGFTEGASSGDRQPPSMPPEQVSAPPVSNTTVGQTEQPTSTPSDYQAQFLQLVNAQRQQAGLQPLRSSPKLAKAAQLHAEEMSRNNDENGYTPPSDLMKAAIREFSKFGVITCVEQPTPTDLVNKWMNSPENRATLLDPNSTVTGIGYVAKGSNQYHHFWVQIVATE